MKTEDRAKTYEVPKLMHFGSLYDLTASGTGSKPENSGEDTMNPQHRP
jgi:hypothetical protein